MLNKDLHPWLQWLFVNILLLKVYKKKMSERRNSKILIAFYIFIFWKVDWWHRTWELLRLKFEIFFFFIAVFPWGMRGQQLEIKQPHFTFFHYIHHFAWVRYQAILSKIFNVIGPSSSRSSNWSSPICFGKETFHGDWGVFPKAFCWHGQTI